MAARVAARVAAQVAARCLPRYVGPEVSVPGRKMTQEEIKARFDAETAAAYNQRKLAWCPGYEQGMGLVLDALKLYLPPSASVLDLGAGTGNLSRRVLQAFQDCHVTLVDFSRNMLAEVPQVLAGFEGRYETRQQDLWSARFSDATYDAVVASFALHHGRGEAVYQQLYQDIFKWLRVPGIFVCYDVIDGDTRSVSDLNEAGWRQFLQSEKFSSADIERIFANYYREDSPLSLKQHLALLTGAGFDVADVLWKQFNFGVYVGAKPC